VTALALSTAATVALISGVVIGLAFVAGLIVMAARRRGARGPDIPSGMRPGPADEVLEQHHIDRTMARGVAFMLLIAPWLAVIWLGEPGQNVDDETELAARSVERGEMWYQISTEENPTGFGCARCHGAEAQGGTVPFTTADGQFIPEYPVPALRDVCGGAATGHPLITSLEDIRTTIMEGREGTPMPSWSIRFAGPMNDQQILDLISYLAEINEENVPEEQNLCTNPQATAATPEPGPTVTPGEPQ
jgi:mono/diheme cytochrome c family protein